jgi:lipid-A-disaccharide synthase
VAFVSLVNLLTGRRVVPELLQGALEPGAVAAEVRRIWEPGPARQAQLEGLRELRARVGRQNTAARVADEVLEVMEARVKEAPAAAPP